MMPEQSVQAGIDARAQLILPIHWGRFSLSLHPWQEPPERALKQADEKQVRIIFPQIGEQVTIPISKGFEPWWRNV
jgi:L-ascorbate metabolism protein UlaG (beta-lactamase superfamily)